MQTEDDLEEEIAAMNAKTMNLDTLDSPNTIAMFKYAIALDTKVKDDSNDISADEVGDLSMLKTLLNLGLQVRKCIDKDILALFEKRDYKAELGNSKTYKKYFLK